MTLYAAGDPPLLLTPVPLLRVPPRAINVHGHVHEQESPRPNRHVNVSVEQTELPPAKLSEIRRLARCRHHSCLHGAGRCPRAASTVYARRSSRAL